MADITVVKEVSANTYLTRGYYGKGKKMKKEKESEKKESKVWDSGFGELYEKIEDRRKKKLFPTMDDMLEVD